MKRGNFTKIIGVLTIITTLITIISIVFNFLIPKYIINASEASSIGIIGSADGPTSIYVTGQSSSNLFTAIFALLSIFGIIYIVIVKKSTKYH